MRLDHAGDQKDMLVILNDNDMSISPNVGGISHYLNWSFSSYYYNRPRRGKFRKERGQDSDDACKGEESIN